MYMETKRLILRNFKLEDLYDLYEYLSDADVVEYEPYRVMNLDEVKDNLAWRMSTDSMIAVCEKNSGKLIGNIYFEDHDFNTKELGYVFNKSFWGFGFAKEACIAVINDAFVNNVHRIYAQCDPDNLNSWRLLEALGFSREAHYKSNIYFWKDDHGNPIWKDTYVYSLLNNLK